MGIRTEKPFRSATPGHFPRLAAAGSVLQGTPGSPSSWRPSFPKGHGVGTAQRRYLLIKNKRRRRIVPREAAGACRKRAVC